MCLDDIGPVKDFVYEDLEVAGYKFGKGVLDELVAECALRMFSVSVVLFSRGLGGMGKGADLVFFVSRAQSTSLETNTFAYEGAYICAFGEFGATCSRSR